MWTDLFTAFLSDVLTSVSCPILTVRQNVEIYVAVHGDTQALAETLRDYSHIPQQGNSPTDRLVSICRAAFSRNIEQLVIVRGNVPHLPTAFVQEAFGRLDADADVVVGPAESGAYYLLGLKRFLPILFQNVPWGTAEVFRTMVNNAVRDSVPIALLPSLYDINTHADVDRLRTDLKRGVASAPATADYLRDTWSNGK